MIDPEKDFNCPLFLTRSMSLDEYADIRNDPRRGGKAPLTDEQYGAMSSIKWGANKPNYQAWNFLYIALTSAGEAAEARWRIKNDVRSEQTQGGCVVFRVGKFERRAAAMSPAPKRPRKR